MTYITALNVHTDPTRCQLCIDAYERTKDIPDDPIFGSVVPAEIHMYHYAYAMALQHKRDLLLKAIKKIKRIR